MRLFEIIKVLKDKSLKNFLVVPCDRLPKKKIEKLPVALIVNLSPSDHVGSHWIAITIDEKREGVYFCSFGLPSSVDHINQFLKNQCISVIQNSKQLQQMHSGYCGEYALAYVFAFLKNNTSMNHFLQNFCLNTTLNDMLIQKIFKRIHSFRN